MCNIIIKGLNVLLKEDCINFINTEMEIKGLGNTKHTTKMPKCLIGKMAFGGCLIDCSFYEL
jgi:hypothetical protein